MTVSPDHSDERALLSAAQSGDRAALIELLESRQAQIYRFALTSCRNVEDAKDVLQETLLTLARKLSSFRGDASLSTWIYTIARNHCRKHRRRERGERSEPMPSAPSDAAPLPDAALADKEHRAALDAAVRRLPSMYREVLVLRDVEGLPAAEVAEVLDLSVEAVKSRLHRARKQVRQQLARLAPPASGCPDILQLWSEQLEGDVSSEACAQMQRHLADCARCRDECDELKRTLALCRTTHAGTPVPPEVQAAVRRAVSDFLDRSA